MERRTMCYCKMCNQAFDYKDYCGGCERRIQNRSWWYGVFTGTAFWAIMMLAELYRRAD